MRRAFFALSTLLLAGLTLSAADPVKSAYDKPTLEAYIRHLFVLPAQITVAINNPTPSPFTGFKEVRVRLSQGAQFQDVVLFVSNDGTQVVQGNLYNIANNPFKPDLDKLKTAGVGAPSLGTSGAPVAIVLFSDLQCPHCKLEAEMLRKNLIQNFPTQVRLYFKDYPIVSLHPWAKAAAAAGRCVLSQSNDAFWEYHDWVYAHQESLTADNLKDQILGWAKDAKGVDAIKLAACINSKTTDPEVEAELQQGQDLNVSGTPTMFINGRRIAQGIEWANLKNIIDQEIEYQKTAKNAGDDCGCEVKLDVPGLQTTTPKAPAFPAAPKKK